MTKGQLTSTVNFSLRILAKLTYPVSLISEKSGISNRTLACLASSYLMNTVHFEQLPYKQKQNFRRLLQLLKRQVTLTESKTKKNPEKIKMKTFNE